MRRTAVERGKDADNAPLLLGGQGRGRARYLNCHDISCFVPLDDSDPFIDTSLGSIPLSTLHVDYTSTLLALAGSSHKKGTNALGTCWTTLSVITVNLESLDDFFPKNHP